VFGSGPNEWTRYPESSSQLKLRLRDRVEMKREDIDLSGAFSDGFESPSFWRIIWDWLREKIKNCVGLPAGDRHRVRTVDLGNALARKQRRESQ
jgi:hypothetical protein